MSCWVLPMKFETSILKQIFSSWSFCFTNNTGWGNVTVVPLYSLALISIGAKVSSSFLFELHCTWQGSGIDLIVTVIQRPPLSSFSTFSSDTLGIPGKQINVKLPVIKWLANNRYGTVCVAYRFFLYTTSANLF